MAVSQAAVRAKPLLIKSQTQLLLQIVIVVAMVFLTKTETIKTILRLTSPQFSAWCSPQITRNVVINIFSPLENEAEDKRVRNDYHTEADLKKLSTPSPTNISIILEQQSTINNLNSKRNQSEDALQAEIKKFNALKDNFNKTSAELVQAKLCFADDFLSAMKKPSTYAEAVRSNQAPGPVTLIADLCDLSSRAPELNAIEELLGSRDGGPVAQSSYHRDGKLFITFGHKQEMKTAINILNSKPKAKEVISATSLLKRLFPMIIGDVATRNYSGPAEIITNLNSVEGNRCLKGNETNKNM